MSPEDILSDDAAYEEITEILNILRGGKILDIDYIGATIWRVIMEMCDKYNLWISSADLEEFNDNNYIIIGIKEEDIVHTLVSSVDLDPI
jgi:hypothetical protein